MMKKGASATGWRRTCCGTCCGAARISRRSRPGKELSAVSYEVDGVRSDREGLPRADADAALLYLKSIAGLNLEELRKPQAGRIKVTIGATTVEIDVKTAGSTAGEKLTLRVIGDETRYKITDIGLTVSQVEAGPQGDGVREGFGAGQRPAGRRPDDHGVQPRPQP